MARSRDKSGKILEAGLVDIVDQGRDDRHVESGPYKA
jgi:hypothetical protein